MPKGKEKVISTSVVGPQWQEIRGGIDGTGRFAFWRVRCVGDTLEVRLVESDVPSAIRIDSDFSNALTLSPRRPALGEIDG